MYINSFQPGKYRGSKFRGLFPCEVKQYLIVISFQEGIFRPNRPAFNLMILYWLGTLKLAQEKEKKLSGLVFYWVIQKKFLRVCVPSPYVFTCALI